MIELIAIKVVQEPYGGLLMQNIKFIEWIPGLKREQFYWKF